MDKRLLFAFLTGVAMSAAAQTAPTVEWANMLDGATTAGDQAIDICLNSDNDLYCYATLGTNTTSDATDLTYAGDYLYTGAPFAGANASANNGNFTLLKTSTSGAREWVVYSVSGDFATNAGGVAPTADGGCIVASKVRHTDGMLDTDITLVDATGATTGLGWTCDKRYYRILLTKISAEGAIEWTRMMVPSTAGATEDDFESDCVSVADIAIDDSGNIFLPLAFSNTLTVTKADGTTLDITPANAGTDNFLLLSLDKDGYYSTALTLSGTAAKTAPLRAITAGGKLYVAGYIVGDGTNAVTIGSAEFTPTEVENPFLICAGSDLSIDWVKAYKGEAVGGKHAIQNVGLDLVNGTLWFCGQYNLKFTDPDDADKTVAAQQGALREGFIVKLDAATGAWLAARDSRDDQFSQGGAMALTGLTGYLGTLQNPQNQDYIYVIGYVLNANVGVFLRRYDAETLEADLDGEYNLMTQGGAPTYQSAAYDNVNGDIYFTVRGNKAFTTIDGTETAAPTGWGVLLSKAHIPGMQSGISDAIGDTGTDAPVEYYNLQGIRVERPESGLYIRRQGSTSTKIIL